MRGPANQHPLPNQNRKQALQTKRGIKLSSVEGVTGSSVSKLTSRRSCDFFHVHVFLFFRPKILDNTMEWEHHKNQYIFSVKSHMTENPGRAQGKKLFPEKGRNSVSDLLVVCIGERDICFLLY